MKSKHKVDLRGLTESERKPGATVQFAWGKRYTVVRIDPKKGIAHLKAIARKATTAVP